MIFQQQRLRRQSRQENSEHFWIRYILIPVKKQQTDASKKIRSKYRFAGTINKQVIVFCSHKMCNKIICNIIIHYWVIKTCQVYEGTLKQFEVVMTLNADIAIKTRKSIVYTFCLYG